MKKLISILALSALLCACVKEDTGTTSGGGDKPTTIVGTVKGNDGSVLQGVVVSDGINCVATDASGRYALPSDLTTTSYVFVSTPSGWSAPYDKTTGQAVFWKFLKDCTKGVDGKYDISFTLDKIANPNRYTVFIFADPQPRRNSTSAGEPVPTDRYAYKSLDCCDDMYDDMRELANTMKDRPVYGIALGDIVHQDLTLLAEYKTGMASTGIRAYSVIGNHDQGHVSCDVMQDDMSHKAFEAEMGPVNYSFNLGNVHYIVVDNMVSPPAGSKDENGKPKYTDDCSTGLTDAIWKWVQNDLALVPTEKTIMVCGHSPMFRMTDNDDTSHALIIKDRSGTHLADLRNLLSKYNKSYAWAGHTHTTFNYVDTKNEKTVETHTLTRVTGALWSNDYQGSNGTPRGYVVLEYDNGTITWKFKPIVYQRGTYQSSNVPSYTYRDWTYVGGRARMKGTEVELSDSYQMQLYAPGVYGDHYICANIFMWDEKWGTPIFTTNGVPNPMDRVTEKDKRFSYSNWELNNFYYKTRKLGVFEKEYNNGKNNCASLFSAFVNEEHGTGTVSVRDRFGNEYSSAISW